MKKLPKKYSLIWWYQTGSVFRAEGYGRKRIARGLLAHISFRLGYKIGKWVPAKEGDFQRIVTAQRG